MNSVDVITPGILQLEGPRMAVARDDHRGLTRVSESHAVVIADVLSRIAGAGGMCAIGQTGGSGDSDLGALWRPIPAAVIFAAAKSSASM